MIRLGTYDINEIQDKYEDTIEDEGMHYGTYRAKIGDHKVKMSSHRLWTFFKTGIKCVECGIEGEFFAKEKNHKDEERPHLNLYALDDGEEVLMTKDHVTPKSKGGDNHIDNYQTMCFKCNQKKGDEKK